MAEGDNPLDDQFEVIRPLGDGAFSKVLLVNNLADDREYALKVLNPGHGVERVGREFATLRRLDHPNIVKAHWAGRLTDGSWYLATEFVPGESLAERLETVRRLDVSEIIRIGDQLLDALREMHPDEARLMELDSLDELTLEQWAERDEIAASGIVHRDIKPENIIVRSDGEVVLVDFGIASRAGTRRATVSYTPGYLPADVHELEPGTWDPDVDRFAAGMVLYECACGLRSDTTIGVRRALPPVGETRSDLPLEFGDFVAQATSLLQQDRFESTTHMAMAWIELRGLLADADSRASVSAPGPSVQTFKAWSVHPHPPAKELTDREMTDLLVEIVNAEGPILCRRLYSLFGQATGSCPTSVLNRLTYRAVRTRRLNQVERPGGGQQSKTVFTPGTDPDVLRTLGIRKPNEVPPVELDAWVTRMASSRVELTAHQQALEAAEQMLSDGLPDRALVDALAYRLAGVAEHRGERPTL